MNIREIKLPRDFDLILDMLLKSFQYPENPDWSIQAEEKTEIVDSIKSLKKIWFIMKFIGIFSYSVKNLMIGLVAEENGIPMGLILNQKMGSTDTWFISTVGVLPEFRRRGIARKLVEDGIEQIKERGGKIIILGVISGNLPAYSLYKDVGFVHFSGEMEMHLNLEDTCDEIKFPEGVELMELEQFEWQPRFEIMNFVTPDEIQQYEPIEVGRYKQSALMRLVIRVITLIQGNKIIEKIVEVDKKAVGRIRIQIRKKVGGKHDLRIYLHKDYAELSDELTKYGLAMIKEFGIDKKVGTEVRQWLLHVIEAFENNGFQTVIEYHRLGLKLD
jgi:ribosomal protein S18 acetylase RimI-like enzyme